MDRTEQQPLGTATGPGPTDAPVAPARGRFWNRKNRRTRPATAPAAPAAAPGHAMAAPVEVAAPRFRVTPLPLVAFVVIVVGAWAAIVPFVGPSFHFGADVSRSWIWNLAHALLSLAPGAAAVLAGLWMMAAVPHLAYERRRPLMGMAGLLAMAAGAWLVIGPFTWPVLEGHGYFFAAGWGLMLRQIGYSLGPGLVIAACGAYALGWASRASRPLGRPASEPAAAMAPERATVTAA